MGFGSFPIDCLARWPLAHRDARPRRLDWTSPATPQVASSQGPWPPEGRARGCNVQARAGRGLEVMRGSTASVRDGDDQLAPHVSFAATRCCLLYTSDAADE